jgi:acetyltransferase
MGLYNLDKIFHPDSIAVVGASGKEGTIGRSVLTNLVEGGFGGEVFPVNPKYDRLQGRRCHPRISDAPATPDLAVIAIPIKKVPDVIDECVQEGVRGAVILSAGGREAGEAGRRVEASIAQKASRGGLRIIGPNCLGIVCPQEGLNASFVARMPPAGKLAFISQSGAICSAMLDLSLKENMGYRYFISIGSMLDVDFGDLIDYVGNDPQVSSVLLYIESLSHFRKFMSAARAVSRMKPIVVLKSGRSEAGARAASSHTGAMTGDDRIYDAAFRRAGMERVGTIGDFFDCAELLAKQDRPAGPRITILTNSGGPGVMTADAVAEYGLSLNPLSEAVLAKLDRVLPAHWSRANPIDILGDADAQRYVDALGGIDPADTDGLLVILNPQAMTDPAEVARELAAAVHGLSCQVFTSWMGGKGVDEGIRVLNEAGIPTFPTPDQAVRAFRHLHDYGKNLALLQEIPSKSVPERDVEGDAVEAIIEKGLGRENGMLTECEAKDILAAYGIPVNPTRLAESKAAAGNTAADIGFPLAMKIASPGIIHKSRTGGVRLGLASQKAVSEAYEEMTAAAKKNFPDAEVQGVTLQPMQTGVELELLVGAKKDANFGPVLLFGWGGVHAEVMQDRNIAPPSTACWRAG